MPALLRSLPVILAVLLAAPVAMAAPDGHRVGRVLVDNREMFEDDPEHRGLFYRAADLFHRRTREEVIRREVLLAPGDPYDPELVAETERNLRTMDFIGEADVEGEPRPDGTVDIHVRTRDKFTLRGEVSVTRLGGVSKGRLSLGDGNLGGTGESLKFSAERRTDRDIDRVKFKEPRLFGTRWSLRAAFSQASGTATGADAEEQQHIEIERPFYRLDQTCAAGAGLLFERGAVRLYEAGREVATVPRDTTREGIWGAFAWGPRMSRRRVRLDLEQEDVNYSAAKGPGAGRVRVRGSTFTQSATLTPAVAYLRRFLAIRHIDGLARTEDITVGETVEAGVGVASEQEKGFHTRHPVPVSTAVSAIAMPCPDVLAAAGANWRSRLRGWTGDSWSASGYLRSYYTGFHSQTVAMSLTADTGDDRRGIPYQTVLGEESGLRGYQARALSGATRYRLNCEDRVFSPHKILSMDVGAVAFFDAGLVVDEGRVERIRDVRKSVGVGFRLGSFQLIGKKVIRVDLAVPLDRDEAGDRPGLSLSFSTGQAFTITHVEEGLSEEF